MVQASAVHTGIHLVTSAVVWFLLGFVTCSILVFERHFRRK